MRPLIVILLLAGFAVAAPVPKAMKKKDDKDLLVGTWTAVSRDGRAVSGETVVVGADGELKFHYGAGSVAPWSWTIDVTETPKRMRWFAAQNPTSKWDCLYELTGDAFTLAFITAEVPPPAKLEPGPGITVYQFTRDTSAK